MDPLFVWVASLVDIEQKRIGGQGGRHQRTRIYWNADVDSALSQSALKEACAAFPDQAGMLREPTVNRIYGVARVQVCDVYHELLQLPSHEAEQLRVFRNKIRSDLVGNMYRVRVLNVQLLGECSVAQAFAGQEMKACRVRVLNVQALESCALALLQCFQFKGATIQRCDLHLLPKLAPVILA